MRVIAGEARGIRLAPIPAGVDIRPTLDRVREAAFNILMPRLPGCRFLDLFAGTGANGIEALSRGAAEAVFVDANAKTLGLIRQNLAKTRLHERGRCLHLDLCRELHRVPKAAEGYDIIYCDPPHAFAEYGGFLEQLSDAGLLAPGGVVVAEHARKSPLPPTVGRFECIREARYGSTTLSLYA